MYKNFALLCVSVFSMRALASEVTCCFEILTNHSVTYDLSRPHGAGCKTSWSDEKWVIVDENGDYNKSVVDHVDPSKLILKRKLGEDVKPLTYNEDCINTGKGHVAECNNPCHVSDASTIAPVSYTATTEQADRDQGINSTIMIAIIVVVLIFIIIIIIICYWKCQVSKVPFSRCRWRAVPKKENLTVVTT